MSAKSKQTNERKLVQGYPLREVYDYEGRGIAVTEFIDGRKVIRRKIMVVEIEPLSFSLFSDAEKRAAVEKFYTLVNSLKDRDALQIHSFVRNKDLSGYIAYLEDKVQHAFSGTINPKSEDFRRQYVAEYTAWLKEQRSSERRYYIVLSSPADVSADVNLRDLAYKVVGALETGKILNLTELMQFLYYVGHPGYDGLKFGPFVKYEELVL